MMAAGRWDVWPIRPDAAAPLAGRLQSGAIMSPRRLRLTHFAVFAAVLDAAVALAITLAGPSLAQPHRPPSMPPFPTSRALPAIALWARRNSDLPLPTIVGVGADSIFAVQRTAQTAPLGVRAVIRQEAITPEFARRLGGRSAAMLVDLDCDRHRVFQRGVELYAGSNRQGPSRQLGAAKDWQDIPPGTFMERVMIAICDPAWRPLYGEDPARPAPASPPPPAPIVAEVLPPLAPQLPAPASSRPEAVAPAAPSWGSRAELGRYDSLEAATAFWNAADLGSTGARLRVELSVVAGRTVYRAVAEGFGDHAAAVAFCRQVQALAGDCAVVD